MTAQRYSALALTDEDRATLLGNGVDLAGRELDPIEGGRGYHVAVWIDDGMELEFMTTLDAPVDEIVRVLGNSISTNAALVGAEAVLVAAVEVDIVQGALQFGREVARMEWSSDE